MRNLAACLLLFALTACGESMDHQNRLKTYGSATGIADWPGAGEALPLPEGVVSQEDAARQKALSTPPPVSVTLLRIGQQRYGIYCAPCHGLAGDGDGFVVARGFPRPLPLSDPKIAQESASRLMDVISNGSGRMYAFSDRVEPADRWAIIAYIRALQLATSRKAQP
jgi:mono/diheme cytochrome c family protein